MGVELTDPDGVVDSANDDDEDDEDMSPAASISACGMSRCAPDAGSIGVPGDVGLDRPMRCANDEPMPP